MQSARKYPSLQERTSTLIINIIFSYIVFVLVTGFFFPSGGLESVWLFSAISFWLLSLLSAPWFVPPRDAIVSAIGSLLILTTMDLTNVAAFQAELELIRWVSVGYAGIITVLALAALFLHDQDDRSPLGRLTFRLTGIFGRGEILFSPPALISVIGAVQPRYGAVAWLVLLWVLITVAKPVERVVAALRQWRLESDTLDAQPSVGMIDRVDHPNIVRVKLKSGSSWKANRLHTASMPDGSQQLVVSLFFSSAGFRSSRYGVVCGDSC